MGYYSDVGIKCEEKAFEMFREAYKEHNFLPGYIYKTDDDIYTLVWEYVKWYQGITCIDAITEVMNELDKIYDQSEGDCEGYIYAFNRIGEDDTDLEHRENSWDLDFYIERKFPIEGEEIDIADRIPKNDVQLSDYLQEGS